MERCRKGERTAVWVCGRELAHKGAHLSADALEQILLKRAKLEEKLLVVTGEELGRVRRQLRRVKHIIEGQ